MSQITSTVHSVTMPQVNVNDEFVTLVNWLVDDGGRVSEGQPLCEVETSKSVGEVPSPRDGFLRHLAGPGDQVQVGEVFARIGAHPEDLDAPIEGSGSAAADHAEEAQQAADHASISTPKATAGAAALAREFNIDLKDIPHSGERIRREDVEACLRDQTPAVPTGSSGRADSVPQALAGLVDPAEPVSEHQWSIARHLEETRSRVLPAHVMMDINADAALKWVAARQGEGVMTSLLPVLIHAAGRAVDEHSALASFRLGRYVYRYRGIDVAYTARNVKGLLYTPVVRGADHHGLDEISTECNRLNMAMMRKQLKPEEMSGACLTVSMLADHPVRFHVGLQNAYQSVLITAGSVREEVRLDDGRPVAVPMMTLALTYDHGLMDGQQAAEALATMKSSIESLHV